MCTKSQNFIPCRPITRKSWLLVSNSSLHCWSHTFKIALKMKNNHSKMPHFQPVFIFLLNNLAKCLTI
jgi:hypothetical protein